jgi:hypothetical protein
MVKLKNFGMDRSTPPIRHDQAVEAKHHTGMAFDLAGRINLRDVPVHSCIPVFPRINDSCTEGIADFGISASQRVV